MDESNALVEARVLVPRDRLAEFYELHSRWLREDPIELEHMDLAAELSQAGILDELEGADRARSWTEGVEVGRLADAVNVYDNLSSGARKILDALLDRPGEEISGDSLGAQLKLSRDKLTGTLASIGIRCRGVNRNVPYRYTSGPSRGKYVVDPAVATLFHVARTPTERMLEAARNYSEAQQRFRIQKLTPPDIKDAHFKGTLDTLLARFRSDTFQVELVSWAEVLMGEVRRANQSNGEQPPAELAEQTSNEKEVQMVDPE